jgi:hypothetical protein
MALLAAGALGAAGCASTESITFVYTIEVQTYGPPEKSERAATVEVRWPDGSKRLSLPGSLNSKSLKVLWTYPKPPKGVLIDLAPFSLEVEASKPEYDSWRALFTAGDFVRIEEGAYQRIDRVRLDPIETKLTPRQRADLSQVLPCGLDSYAEQYVGDMNGDGHLDVVLYRPFANLGSHYRGTRRSAAQAPCGEIRYMSLIGTEWKCSFLANHRGIFLDGKNVEEAPREFHGYHCGYRCLASFDGQPVTLNDFYAVDPEGRRMEGAKVRGFVWRKGAASFEMTESDTAPPRR